MMNTATATEYNYYFGEAGAFETCKADTGNNTTLDWKVMMDADYRDAWGHTNW